MVKIIANGTDKQNDWAQKIADTWMSKIDTEIEANNFREPGSKYYHIKAILRGCKDKAVAKLASTTSKQIIDMYTRQQMLDTYVINTARKMAENQTKEN